MSAGPAPDERTAFIADSFMALAFDVETQSKHGANPLKCKAGRQGFKQRREAARQARGSRIS